MYERDVITLRVYYFASEIRSRWANIIFGVIRRILRLSMHARGRIGGMEQMCVKDSSGDGLGIFLERGPRALCK